MEQEFISSPKVLFKIYMYIYIPIFRGGFPDQRFFSAFPWCQRSFTTCSRRQGLRKCRTSSTDGCRWTGENSWPCTGCGSSASTAELQYSRPRLKTDFQDGDVDREPDWPAATAEATTSRSHSGCAAAGWWKWAAPSGQRWRQCASVTFCKKSFTLSSDIFLSAMESYADVTIFASKECCWCVQRSGRRLKCFHSSRSIFKDTVFQINGMCLGFF